jgi:pimeloyl-ACP methyl ester carboxylesterase
MKSIFKILVILTLAICYSFNTYAQKKIGVFIHGFNGNDEKWSSVSKAPSEFKNNGTIDDYVVFNYDSKELLSENSQAAMFARFVSQMDQKGNRISDEWILIGHSLGGIVSRVLYPSFRSYSFNVVAVVSIGGPLQGAYATDVDKAYMKSEFDRLKAEFKLATDNEHPWITFKINFYSALVDIANIMTWNFEPTPRDLLNMIPNMIVEV